MGGGSGEERHISGVTSKKRKHNFPAGARARRRPKNGSSFSPWRSEWLWPRSLKCDISRHSQLRGLLFPPDDDKQRGGRGGAGRAGERSILSLLKSFFTQENGPRPPGEDQPGVSVLAPLGMADTKRFFHQGRLRSDFSSSLSFLSSTCGDGGKPPE